MSAVAEYGRWLDEFEVGVMLVHPWEVTIDEGLRTFAQASFLDATPLYASDEVATALGHPQRPVPPLVLLNLALSFSVEDVSERAIAHLGYEDLWFPEPCYVGTTVRARSVVLGVRPARDGERGVVRVNTLLETLGGKVVCRFRRAALVPARPGAPRVDAREIPTPATVPLEARLRDAMLAAPDSVPRGSVPAVGSTICHGAGRTVGESEHMQLTTLFRNTHPLHTDEGFARGGIAGTRVVYGGLVFAWVVALASRDVSRGLLCELKYDCGAHPNPVVAGDTLYAATRVLDRRDVGECASIVTVRHVGTKNVRTDVLLDRGVDLFRVEGEVPARERTPEKVFEIERTMLVAR